MHCTLLVKQGRIHVVFSNGSLHMDEPDSDNQGELTYNSSVQKQDIVRRSCRERWMIGTNGEIQGTLCSQRDLMVLMIMYLHKVGT